ncbi:MAG: 2OG-Fe(II) oxygenase [Planctomycetes bacterium]|nr:2OG-Fe(II) oxygenase [Planctomycetota bacterium]
MPAYRTRPDAVPADRLRALRERIRASPWFTTNNLNRDFVGTQGFSVVFHGTEREAVHAAFPFFQGYLDLALRTDCNAFYLNALQLGRGSHVAPHVDRSLHAYCLDVDPPVAVSVLYVEVPPDLRGGRLVLRRGQKFLGRITPQEGLLLEFDGDLEHAVERVDSPGRRLSLVCEQYSLSGEELATVPRYAVESRARSY